MLTRLCQFAQIVCFVSIGLALYTLSQAGIDSGANSVRGADPDTALDYNTWNSCNPACKKGMLCQRCETGTGAVGSMQSDEENPGGWEPKSTPLGCGSGPEGYCIVNGGACQIDGQPPPVACAIEVYSWQVQE